MKSSAASATLAFFDPLGQVVTNVSPVAVPINAGIVVMEAVSVVPVGAVRAGVVLKGFSPTDGSTAGTVTFDDAGLFA